MHEAQETQPGHEEQLEAGRSTFDNMSLKDLVAIGIRHLDAADEARKLGTRGEEEVKDHEFTAGEINGVLEDKHQTMLGHQIILDMDTLERRSRLEDE